MTAANNLPLTPATNGAVKGAIDAPNTDKLSASKPANGKAPQTPKSDKEPGKKPAKAATEQDWKARLFGTTIRGRLLRAVLPTVLVPLMGVSGLAIFDIRKTAQETQLLQLKEQALLVAEDNAAELFGIEKGLQVLATTPSVIDAARAVGDRAVAENLPQQADATLEARFATTKLLVPDQGLNDYLKRVAEVEGFAEVFFTDRNGYNVAYSQPTSDFVQDDEGWWTQGRDDGFFLDAPELDASTNSLNVDLIQQINDPNTGAFLGLVKAGLPTDAFALSEAFLKEAGLSGTQKVQVLDTSSGTLLTTITPEGSSKTQEIEGGSDLLNVTRFLLENIRKSDDVEGIMASAREQFGLKQFTLSP
ncbi:MAG: PDC sensor domain-containing protein, partial [Cyanobacteria bacterium J06648_11]